MQKRSIFLSTVIVIFLVTFSIAQERSILVPQRITGAPFQINDQNDLFGKAYRWFMEGEYAAGTDSLKKLIEAAGFKLEAQNYYVLVANFTDSMTPIGLIHGDDDFFSNRLFGLKEDNLYYIYISRQASGESFLSVLATAKQSPFLENLPLFIGLFQPLPISQLAGPNETWIDVRRFKIPRAYRKFSDLSFLVKKELADEKILARTVFDNTSKERWSYGIATAITSVSDVDITVGADGTLIVKPKPNLDLAAFAVINYHFKEFDTKAPTFGNSFHLLGGIRMIDFVEPIVGIGGGVDLSSFAIHLFAGYSVEFARELKAGYSIGQTISKEVDPFKTKLRGKPRFGIEIKFP